MSGVGDTGVIGDGKFIDYPALISIEKREKKKWEGEELRRVETKNVPEEVPEMRREVLHEETGRRFDPNAVYDLDLNTDSEEE
jgi:transcriptional regulator of NAD metabolism